MNKRVGLRWMRLGVLVLLIGAVGFTTGCEPLRKKFVRKKKEDDIQKPEVILDPQDYPVKVKTTLETYQQHYMLWKVWLGELSRFQEEPLSDKKIISTLTRMQNELTEMRNLLSPQAQADFENVWANFKQLEAEFEKPESLRNKNYLSSLLRSLGRTMREIYGPKNIASRLKTE